MAGDRHLITGRLLPFLALLVRGAVILIEPVLLDIANDGRRDEVADTHLTA